MTTFPELVRSRATQIGEIRRTGRQDLAANLLGDLFKIAEGLETSASASAIAALLSDGLGIPAPSKPDVSAYPYLATFKGQGEMLGHVVDLDDRYSYPVSQAEAEDAAGAEGLLDAVEFDALSEAAAAPAEVRAWSGPFEITIARRLYRIESDHAGAVPFYADTIAEVQALLTTLFTEEAESYEQAIAQPLAIQIAGLTEDHLDAAGACVRFHGIAMEQAVRAQVLSLEYLPDAEA